ncbi:hypothetical protein Scep_024189 [Stephania cephalantha]|uniref:Uncharacterized protein n=1 Tax=Stephania cephalantha TaxID=152367 RepID=A0AAP0EWR0_9MAGN
MNSCPDIDRGIEPLTLEQHRSFYYRGMSDIRGSLDFQGDWDLSSILRSTQEMSPGVVGMHNLRSTRGMGPGDVGKYISQVTGTSEGLLRQEQCSELDIDVELNSILI